MRNYQENPLKIGELIPKEDLIEIFINQNHSLDECYEHYNTTKTVLRRQLKLYGITKPRGLQQQNIEKSTLKKYGVKNIFEKADFIKQKTKEKYGVENVSSLDSVKEKRKQTCQEKYGGNAPACSQEVKDAMIATNQERYGGNAPMCNDEIKQKSKETCLERYGVDSFSKCPEFIEKVKQTCNEHFGVDFALQNEEVREKAKETNLEKYGTEYASQSQEFRNKVIETSREKYGCDSYLQTEEFRERSKQACLEKYGVDHQSKSEDVQKQIRQSMKDNDSFRKSIPEEKVYSLLITKFPDVIRQYSDDRYPFKCDFYIPSLDLFIEYQGYQGHGKHPFNENNAEDIKILNSWKEKLTEEKYIEKKKNQYSNYIEVWTIKDPLKRKTVKENNLNWIEFFTFNDFLTWFEKI